MNEPSEFFRVCDAERGKEIAVIAEPFCQPCGDEPHRICGNGQVHRDRTSRQDLLPFRDFDVGARGADHGNHERGAGETAAFNLRCFGLRIRVQGRVQCTDQGAKTMASLALDHNKPPGREFTVIGDTGGDGEEGLELVRIRPRAGHEMGSDRASGFKEIEHIIHRMIQNRASGLDVTGAKKRTDPLLSRQTR